MDTGSPLFAIKWGPNVEHTYTHTQIIDTMTLAYESQRQWRLNLKRKERTLDKVNN